MCTSDENNNNGSEKSRDFMLAVLYLNLNEQSRVVA
jgi:hypothetical protein